jgi:DNA-binding IclR family transcriptional regulator
MGADQFKITTDIGVEVPIPWTASGRLLLDHMTRKEILNFVPKDDFRLPDGRVVDATEFIDDIARARADSCCMTNGLSDRFTCCLAAPVRDRKGIAVATICFIVPIDTAETHKRELLDLLKREAEELFDR